MNAKMKSIVLALLVQTCAENIICEPILGAFVQSRPPRSAKHRCEDMAFHSASLELAMGAIFDGHQGAEAAEIAKNNLPDEIQNRALLKNGCVSEQGIKDAFAEIQNKIEQRKTRSGACAVVAFITKSDEQSILHVAHAGDSIAKLTGRYDNENAYTIKNLTVMHRPACKKEQQRIASRKRKMLVAEAASVASNKEPRTKEASAKKRLYYSESYTDQAEVTLPEILPQTLPADQHPWGLRTGLDVTRCFGHKELHGEGLTCDPEISHTTLSSQDKMLFLMSDGVHEHISDIELAAIAESGIAQNKTPEEIAKIVVERAARNDEGNRYRNKKSFDAVKLGISDDMSVVVFIL